MTFTNKMKNNFYFVSFKFYINKIIIIIIILYLSIIFCKNKFLNDYFKNNTNKKQNYKCFFKQIFLFHNKAYKFIRNKCIVNYSFRALYISNLRNEKVQIINKIYEKNIKKLICDYKEKAESESSGLHEIVVLFNIDQLNTTSNMFLNISNLILIDFTFKVKDMEGLFYGCSSLTSINLTNIKTSNVLNMKYMFSDCSSLKSINIGFFVINKKNNLNYMFNNCKKLISVNFPVLDGKNRKKISDMFLGCSKLLSLKMKAFEYKHNKLNDICIIGLWYGSNYGSMLTYFALHEVVKNLGYSILMIDNPLGSDKDIYDPTSPKVKVSSFYRISKKKG